MSSWQHRVAVFAVSTITGLAGVRSAGAVTVYVVNSPLDQIDDNTNDGLCRTAANTCTLRAAVMQTNPITGGTGVTIQLPAGTYTLTLLPIGPDGDDNGDLNFTAPGTGSPVISLVGAGAATTILDANQIDRVLSIATGRTVNVSGVTIRNGFVSAAEGGGIDCLGTLGLTDATLLANQAQKGGGVAVHGGAATLTRIRSEGNSASVVGGGAYFYNSFVDLDQSTIYGNNSAFEGGGVSVENGQTTIRRSTIDGNGASSGGGILSNGGLTIIESTISNNNASVDGGGVLNGDLQLKVIESTISNNNAYRHGGGIYNGSTINLYSVSIVLNQADSSAESGGIGGGIFNPSLGTTVNLRNSLLAANYLQGAPVYDDCTGPINTYGNNAFWSIPGTCAVTQGDGGAILQVNSLNLIGGLAKNGGPTQTHALLPGSNAIDAGDPTLGCIGPDSQPFANDQRGAARIHGVRCDLGAYEEGELFLDGFESRDVSSWSVAVP